MLDIAVENGQAETVEFLLANGANPNALDSRGESPLYWAVGTGTNTVRLQILSTLLRAGANPNFKSRSSEAWTPLMWAADLSEPEMVRLLLLNGAEVNMTNAAGQNALILAHDPEVTNLLVKAGAR
jgi:ankyrin repeat protein